MKTFFVLFIILFLFSNIKAQVANKIDKLDVNQLRLPKESASKATYIDATGQVKSSTISDTELGYLSGLTGSISTSLSNKENTITPGTSSQYFRGDKTFQTLDKSAVGLGNVDNTSDINKAISSATQTALNAKANDSDVVKLTGDQTIQGIKTFTGKLKTQTTTSASIPCPVMTQTQRDLIIAVTGDCVFNSTAMTLNIYDGSVWKSTGGAGGVSLWLTGTTYALNDVVIQSDKIYRATIAHTSGTFATDLASGKWVEVSASITTPVSLANGGTNKNITASAGSVVYSDADSFELLSGTSGQILQSNGASSPTFVNKSILGKSQQDVSSSTLEEVQAPNKLLTQVSSNKYLNETGNKNILSNPSFEHSTFSTNWVNSAGTFTEETSVIIDGKKSAKLVLSAQTMSLTQSSTLYQAQFADGIQGLASVRVKSDVALKVCSIQAGTISTTNCVNTVSNNKWGLYKVPMILGATSNGISIASTGAVSGTVYIDDSYVGATDLTQNINACNDVSCETVFSASVTTAPSATNENIDFISTCTGTSTKTCNFNSGIFSVAPNCAATQSGAVNFGETRIDSINSSSIVVTTFNSSGSGVNSPFYLTCQKQGVDFTNAKQLSNGNTYSSTNADTDWASCTPSSSQGFGTPAFSVQCKRQGSDLLMKGQFTSGVPTAVEARIGLPLWNGSQLVSAGSSIIPVTQEAGVGSFNVNSAAQPIVLIDPNVSYFNFGLQASLNAGLSKVNGSSLLSNTNVLTFFARIPIEGWQNSNIIIGQFNGLESCASTLDCTDTFSAKISAAGVVSDENVDFINGNCSYVGSTATCTWNTNLNTVPLNCNVTPANTCANESRIINPVPVGSISFVQSLNSTAGACAAQIICQKQGVDYIGKTAKAVASDQNVRTIGATGVDIQSVFFGAGADCTTNCTAGNCTICSQVGSKITSVSFVSLGQYNLNGIDGTKYICSGSANSVGQVVTGIRYSKADATSTSARIITGLGTNLLNANVTSVMCIGTP